MIGITKKSAATIFLSFCLIFSVGTAYNPAEAEKSEGTPLLDTNSAQVCGQTLCKKQMTIAEKIRMYISGSTENSQPTIMQQAFVPLNPSSKSIGSKMVKDISQANIPKMKLFASVDVKKFSKLDVKKTASLKSSMKSLKSFNDPEKFSKLLKFADKQKFKLKSSVAKLSQMKVTSKAPKLSDVFDEKPKLHKETMMKKLPLDSKKQFKGERDKIPMKIVKELSLKVPKIKKSQE